MTFDAVSPDPSVAAPIPAPQAPEGADLLIKAAPHDQGFWDRHPDVERYRLETHTGATDDALWTLLVWLKARPGEGVGRVAANGAHPTRPADAEFVVHSAYDQEFFGRHPDVEAWTMTLQLNDDGAGSVRKVQVWMTPGAI